jgi:hypothetical protein
MKTAHFVGNLRTRKWSERNRPFGRCPGSEFTEMENLMEHPATKRRGSDPEVKNPPAHELDDAAERKLEQGLEESMAGSDPVSITQPSKSKIDKQHQEKEQSTNE